MSDVDARPPQFPAVDRRQIDERDTTLAGTEDVTLVFVAAPTARIERIDRHGAAGQLRGVAIHAGENPSFVFVKLVAMKFVVEDDSGAASIGVDTQGRMTLCKAIELNQMTGLTLVVFEGCELVVASLVLLMTSRAGQLALGLQWNPGTEACQAEPEWARCIEIALRQALGGSREILCRQAVGDHARRAEIVAFEATLAVRSSVLPDDRCADPMRETPTAGAVATRTVVFDRSVLVRHRAGKHQPESPVRAER